MQLWVDADACPVAVREILYRAAGRTGLRLTLVANHRIPVPAAPNVRFVRVAAGFDVADDYLAAHIQPGDLLVSNDLPLADAAISRGARVLNTRGELLDAGNIKPRLSMRDFLDTLRASGIDTGGSAPLRPADRKAFADALDRILAEAGGPRP